MSKRVSNNRKSRLRKAPARSTVRFGWREKQRRALAFEMRRRLANEQAVREGRLIEPEVTA